MSEVQTVAQASAQANTAVALINAQVVEFAKVLPAAVPQEKFGRWALSVVRAGLSNPKQAEHWARVLGNEAGKLSLLTSLMDCASLGLEPGREYHLVPFAGIVTGITDYRGEVRLITNAARCTVVAMLVHEKDDLTLCGGNKPPVHNADWFGDRGELVGGYAYVDYGQDLHSTVVRMSLADLLKHKEASKTSGRSDSPWVLWFEAMCLKTLVHQVRKLVPWSVERQWT